MHADNNFIIFAINHKIVFRNYRFFSCTFVTDFLAYFDIFLNNFSNNLCYNLNAEFFLAKLKYFSLEQITNLQISLLYLNFKKTLITKSEAEYGFVLMLN